MPASPQVIIIVLSYNGSADTLACLASLRQIEGVQHRALVVDNASRDDSVAAVRAAFPDAEMIASPVNLGFTGGNNLGLERALAAGADYALLLNNDTEVSPDFLQKLFAACDADERIAMAGPTIFYHSLPDVVWSAGGEIRWERGDTRMTGMAEKDHGQWGLVPRPVDFVTGCALLVRLSAARQFGLLDDRFFAYYEETEWCVRAARAGHIIAHIPGAKIWHKITPQAREASPQVHYYMTRNRLLFLRLAHAPLRAWLFTLADLLRTTLSWTLKPRWRHKKAQRNAMLRALADYARGRFGRVDIS